MIRQYEIMVFTFFKKLCYNEYIITKKMNYRNSDNKTL